jgi:hypothetical protein
LGINIARANRVEFFAIPAERVRAFLKEKSAAIKKAGSKL